MKPMINYARHYIDKKDLKSVEEVLKSDFLSQGPETSSTDFKSFLSI